MKNKYTLRSTPSFDKGFRDITKKNQALKVRVESTLLRLAENPFHPGLKTHKADTILYGYKYSSRVTGDIRIIWDLQDGRIILLLTINTHDVYK